ncbi:MAG: hypothetical protein ACI857_001527 [Arenicella sp.]|jgi:hypothetical protein
MKKLMSICLAVVALGFLSMAIVPSEKVDSDGAYVYIYLKNECSHSVKYEYKYSGSSTSGEVAANYKKQVTLRPSAKLYVDGDFIKEIEDSDDKQVFVVCK